MVRYVFWLLAIACYCCNTILNSCFIPVLSIELLKVFPGCTYKQKPILVRHCHHWCDGLISLPYTWMSICYVPENHINFRGKEVALFDTKMFHPTVYMNVSCHATNQLWQSLTIEDQDINILSCQTMVAQIFICYEDTRFWFSIMVQDVSNGG